MKNQNETQNKAATTIGFVGLLLGILINAFSAIELDEYEISSLVAILFGFLVTICCLVMSALTAIATHLNNEGEYREQLLGHSQYWLVGGIAGITASIPAIIFKTNQMVLVIAYIILLAGLLVASAFEFKLISKPKPSQSQPMLKPNDDIQPKVQ